MRKLIIALYLIFGFDVLAMSEVEKDKLDTYLCMGTRAEYFQCKTSGLSKCIKKAKKRYNQDLNCKKLLTVEIDEKTDKLKEMKFEWAKTCAAVKKEYEYCLLRGYPYCSNNMEQRYEYLWCEYALEKKLRDFN